MNINTYTIEEWAGLDELTTQDIKDMYGEDVVKFYADERSAVAGCEHSDGTYSSFGCNMEEDGLTYEEMLIQIKCGM